MTTLLFGAVIAGLCTEEMSGITASYSIQPIADFKLSVQFSMEPQLTTFLGFYNTLFPASFIVNVTNIGKLEFPSLDLDVDVQPPSGKYHIPITISVPKLLPKKSFVQRCSFKPEEGGVYTITVPPQWLDLPSGRISSREIIDSGFIAQDFKGPETVFALLALIVTVLGGLYGYKRMKR
jgi:hypothetical protein